MIDLLVFVLMVSLGLLILFFGWRIWKKEEIRLINSYHHQKVSEEDKKDYTEEMGKATILMGMGIILMAAYDLIAKARYGWVFLTIFSILGFLKMIRAQKKYNDGIF